MQQAEAIFGSVAAAQSMRLANAIDWRGKSVLMHAASRDHAGMVELLVRHKVATLGGKQGGSALGQLALRSLLSAPDRAPGCPELRPASANQPLRAALAGHIHTGLACDPGTQPGAAQPYRRMAKGAEATDAARRGAGRGGAGGGAAPRRTLARAQEAMSVGWGWGLGVDVHTGGGLVGSGERWVGCWRRI